MSHTSFHTEAPEKDMFSRDLSKLVVGQKVAVTNGRYGRYSTNKDYTVKTITPTGFVTVTTQRVSKLEGDKAVAHEEHTLRFNKDNRCLTEYSKDFWIRADLDVIEEEERVHKTKNALVHTLGEASLVGRDLHNTYSKESFAKAILEMEEKLAFAKSLLNQL
jgi:hypothetical protein